jgi:phospholipid/cholesterol/gamma-HCH transport system substrate-binding protein
VITTCWAAPVSRLAAAGCAVALTATGCAFSGLNSLPLPGTVGRGSGAHIYHVEIANVSTLESNSPVMLNDVIVGSVGKMAVKGWHADVELSVRPDVVLPANAVVTVGQTSLLGSLHISVDPPLGQTPAGRLTPGATIPLSKSSTYPSTEQTLSSVSAVLNAGHLGQIGDVIHEFNAALSGREGQVRDLLTRLDTFVGTFDDQRDNIVATVQAVDRLGAKMADRNDVIDEALTTLPPALRVLDRERPRLITALEKLGTFSDLATRLVHDSQADIIKDLQDLEPTTRALADVGPELDAVLASFLTKPYTQSDIDRYVRGDYVNTYLILDLTLPRLKRGLLLGTRWGQEGAPMPAAPGDPYYQRYTYDPLGAGVAAPSPASPDQPPVPAPPTADAPVPGAP